MTQLMQQQQAGGGGAAGHGDGGGDWESSDEDSMESLGNSAEDEVSAEALARE